MIGSIAFWIRADLRRRKQAVLGLAVLTTLAAVVPMVVAAGAQRTATSLDRMRKELRPRHLDVQFHEGEAPADALERLARLPGVVNAGEAASILARPKGSDRDQAESFGQGGLDEALGRDFERARLDAGRRARAADEVMVSSRLAAELDIGVGDTLLLETYTEGAVESIFQGNPAGYDGPEISLRVVGVGRQPEELTAGEDSPSPLFLVGPAFFEAWAGKAHFFDGIFVVRLADGPQGISSFEKAVHAEFPDRQDLNVHVSEEDARIEDAVSTQAIALALLALAAMVSGTVVLTQAATRFGRSSAADQQILEMLGLDRRAIALGRAGAAALPVAAGVLTAVGVAIGASGLFPTGPAGRLEPDPGISVDGAVLALFSGFFVVVALTATAVLGRARSGGAPARSSKVARLVSQAAPLVAATVGIRSALQADRGPRAVPVRSAMIACGAGLAGLIAALVLATSLDRLVGDPVRYGWNWDYEVALGDELTDDGALEQARPIVEDERVEGAFYARIASKALGGEQILTFGVKPLSADLTTAIVEGRNVRGDDEIVLGRTTLDRLGKGVGDSLEVEGPGGRAELRVVGQGLFPTTENDDPAAGAVVTLATMNRLPGSNGYPNLYITVAPGSDHSALRRDLEERGAFITGAVPPSVVTNLDRIAWTPYLLAGYLGLLGAAATGHALLTAIRRRRGELAVLKAIGFVRSQVAVTVLTQSVTFTVVGLLLGVPIGWAVGRWAWRLMAGGLGFADDPSIPVVALLVIGPAAVAIAGLIASAPAYWAARTRPATILHTE